MTHTPKTTKKSSLTPQRLALLLAIGAFVVIGLTAVVVFIIAQPKHIEQPTQQTKQSNEPREKLTAAKVLARAKEYFKGTESAKTSLSIPVKAKGQRFYSVATDPAATKNAAATLPKAEATRNVASLEHMLEYDQFTRTVVKDGEKDTEYLADFTRSNDDVTCQIKNTPVDPKKLETRFVEFKCLDDDDYTALAKHQLPLFNAYSPAASSSYDIGIVGTMSVRDSKLAGYKLAEIPVGSVLPHAYTPLGIAMFYQLPDGRWNFFNVRQSETLVCSLYKGKTGTKVDFRSIFQGLTCRDLEKGVTATVEPPKRSE